MIVMLMARHVSEHTHAATNAATTGKQATKPHRSRVPKEVQGTPVTTTLQDRDERKYLRLVVFAYSLTSQYRRSREVMMSETLSCSR